MCISISDTTPQNQGEWGCYEPVKNEDLLSSFLIQ